jgi:hypothetical protein
VRYPWILVFAWMALPWASPLRADFAADLARIHVEAIGGHDNVKALKAVHATGVTRIQGRELRFALWAARPNWVRTEATEEGRVLIQAYDGANPPWVMDSKTGKVFEMGIAPARAFKADADFDDPLVPAGRGRNVSLDYAGETEIAGRPVFKILVTQNFTESAFIYLDHTTYLIIRRDAVRIRSGAPERVETWYDDFRPVKGVLLPHRLTEKSAGQVRSETVLERIDGNPPLAPGFFTRPAVTAGK